MQLRHSPSMLLLLSPLLAVGIITVVLALRFAPDSADPRAGFNVPAVGSHGPA